MATPIALWVVIRAFGLEFGGPLTAAMVLTPYVAIAGTLVMGVAVAFRNWAAAAIAAVAAGFLAAIVLPRALCSETMDPAGRETFTVLSANVYRGTADTSALMELVDRYRPDLLSVQELTPSFARRLRSAGIRCRLPEAVLMARPKGHGAGLYSRHRLTRVPRQTRLLFRMPRATITFPNGRRLRVVAVHPQPPTMSYDSWREALDSLPTPGTGVPWVLAGDFNATLDQDEFRGIVDGGYRDAGQATGQGLVPTWPGPEVLPRGLITIDHVLADTRLGVADYGVDDLPGGDHRAIHARLVLPYPAVRGRPAGVPAGDNESDGCAGTLRRESGTSRERPGEAAPDR